MKLIQAFRSLRIEIYTAIEIKLFHIIKLFDYNRLAVGLPH